MLCLFIQIMMCMNEHALEMKKNTSQQLVAATCLSISLATTITILPLANLYTFLMGKHIWCLSSIRASTSDVANMANAKNLAIGIWHICHIKHKNETLSDVPNSKNYKTPLQYEQMLQNFLLFYILFSLSSLFIFSFLFSLIHRFPRSSPCTSSLSL